MNTKSKGNTFERRIAKELSLVLTDGAEEYAIWRSTNSGGHSTILKQSHSNYASTQVGDLCKNMDGYEYVDSFFSKFFIECKALKDFNIIPPLNKKEIIIFEQVVQELEVSQGKTGIIIVKRNNKAIIVLAVGELAESLYKYCRIKSGLILDSSSRYYVFEYNDFLSNIKSFLKLGLGFDS